MRDDQRAMSEENLEVVLAAYARFNAGEREPSLDYWHEDGEYVAYAEDPDSETHYGFDAIRRQFIRWVEAYPDLRVEPLDVKGNQDKVFLWVRFIGHGAASGLPIQMELAHVCTLRDGKTVRVVEYGDRDEGLRAAGLTQ
jgi:ketosteroid isomerase-like protein